MGAAKQTRCAQCAFATSLSLSCSRIVCNLILCVPALHSNERISSIRSRFMGVLPLQIIPRRPGKVFQTTTMKFHPSLFHPVRASSLIILCGWRDWTRCMQGWKPAAPAADFDLFCKEFLPRRLFIKFLLPYTLAPLNTPRELESRVRESRISCAHRTM